MTERKDKLSKPQRVSTYEDVWATLQEIDRLLKETAMRQQETDRQQKETERRQQETERQLTKSIAAMEKAVSRIGNRLGEVIEQLTTPDLHRKFRKMGYTFDCISRDKEFPDATGQSMCEVDVFLENGEYAMAVEVKTHLTSDDINAHKERMAVLRRYANSHGDSRRFIGAVAVPIIQKSLRKMAEKAGFYVIEPSEDSVKISMPEGFKPKEW